MQAAAEAKRRKKKEQAEANMAEIEDQWNSTPGAIAKAMAGSKKGKKAFFADNQGDGTVDVSVRQAGGKVRWQHLQPAVLSY